MGGGFRRERRGGGGSALLARTGSGDRRRERPVEAVFAELQLRQLREAAELRRDRPRKLVAGEVEARERGAAVGEALRQQLQEGGDIGDTIAIILGVLIILTAVCAFLGWYSRRRG